jgi:hypothetical protein
MIMLQEFGDDATLRDLPVVVFTGRENVRQRR